MNDGKLSVDQAQDELVRTFNELNNQHPSVFENDFRPTGTIIYSLEIIKNLLYLNKDLLRQDFLNFADTQSSQDGTTKSKAEPEAAKERFF